MIENKIHIYPAILSAEDLSYSEKLMISIIFSLSEVVDDKFGCSKSNKELGAIMNITENHAAKLISILKSKEYLTYYTINHNRTLITNTTKINNPQ